MLKRTRCHEKESIQEWKLLKHSKKAKETRFILSCYCRNCWFNQSGNNAANRQVCFWEKEGVLNFIQKWPSGYWQISHGVQKHGGGAGRELSESGMGGILRRWRAFAPGFWWEMQSPGSVFTFHSPSTIRTCSSGQPSIRAAKPERATLWVEGWGSEPGAISLSPLEKSRKLETGFSHACVTHLTWFKQQNSSSKRGRARARYCSSNKPNMEPKAISNSPPSPSHPVNQTVRIPLQSAGRLLLSLDAKASPYLVTLSLLALPCIYPQQTPESILQLVRPPITGLIITPESKTASMTPTAQWSPVPTTPSALIKTWCNQTCLPYLASSSSPSSIWH